MDDLIQRDWRSEDHDPHCESRMMGRCDCLKYIVIDCGRKFKADLAAILKAARTQKGESL